MEIVNENGLSVQDNETGTAKREDKQLLVVLHFTQLLSLLTGFGGFLVPLVIWVTKKDEIQGIDFQGKQIINFQISLFLYALGCIPLMLLFGLGFVLLIILLFISIILPIVNGINVSNGKKTDYPFSIKFLK